MAAQEPRPDDLPLKPSRKLLDIPTWDARQESSLEPRHPAKSLPVSLHRTLLARSSRRAAQGSYDPDIQVVNAREEAAKLTQQVPALCPTGRACVLTLPALRRSRSMRRSRG
jgi:hypothetical protein